MSYYLAPLKAALVSERNWTQKETHCLFHLCLEQEGCRQYTSGFLGLGGVNVAG